MVDNRTDVLVDLLVVVVTSQTDAGVVMGAWIDHYEFGAEPGQESNLCLVNPVVEAPHQMLGDFPGLADVADFLEGCFDAGFSQAQVLGVVAGDVGLEFSHGSPGNLSNSLPGQR